MENLTPYFTDDDYGDLTLHIQERLEQLEQLPHPPVREAMFDLLGSIDMMHREALTRLLLIVQKHTPQLLEQFQADIVIRSMLSLYEFIDTENEPEPEPPPVGNTTFIPLDQISVSPKIKEPIWIPGGHVNDLQPGSLQARKFEDVEVVLINAEAELFALRNACLDSILPLSAGSLEGHVLTCPWHGCRYDVRTGEIQNGSRLKLETYPVVVGENGKFHVGFNIPDHQNPLKSR
jgi:3-phenylpropionate/trans-cinnamate dioxygenase ferredoxin subunit